MSDHPFFPRTVVIPHYAPAAYSTADLLTVFFSAVFIILGVSWWLSGNTPAASTPSTTKRTSAAAKPNNKKNSWGPLPIGTRLVFLWFVACGFIHGVVEGYFALNHRSISTQYTFFADLWKEYSMSDSRYMTQDAFVSVMESMTAVLWGPLSFVTAGLIWKGSPSRHLLQFLISTGQLYGDVAYYLTAAYDNFEASSPHPFHFYFYFVFLNAFWIVIPLLIMWSSGKEIIRSLEVAAAKPKSKKQ